MDLFQNITVTAVEEMYTVYFPKDRTVHMHDRNSYGLSFCVSGQLTYTMGDIHVISEPDNAVLLPKGGNYHIHGDKEGVFPVINFQCTDFPQNQLVSIPLSNPKSCLRDCETLRNLLRSDGNRLEIFRIFYGLLSKIDRNPDGQKDPLRTTLRFIDEHLNMPDLGNIAIAQAAHISESYLRKLFIQHYSTTPKQYILDLRIQKAKLLLTDFPVSVTDIAEKCGFSSVYHFCKAFKARTGVSPTQYAERHRRHNI